MRQHCNWKGVRRQGRATIDFSTARDTPQRYKNCKKLFLTWPGNYIKIFLTWPI